MPYRSSSIHITTTYTDHKKMGRRARDNKPFEIKRIQHNSKRKTTEMSRQFGFFKKGGQLSELCGTNIFIATITDNGVVTVFTSENENSREGAKMHIEHLYNAIGSEEYVQVYNKDTVLDTFKDRNIVYRHPAKNQKRRTMYDVTDSRIKKNRPPAENPITTHTVQQMVPAETRSDYDDIVEHDRTMTIEQMKIVLGQTAELNGGSRSDKTQDHDSLDYLHDEIEDNINSIVPNLVENFAQENGIPITQNSIETIRHTKAQIVPSIDGKVTIQTTQTVEVKKTMTLDISSEIDKWKTLLDKF